MCSVVGCIGTKPVNQLVVQGLARTEYRGYDSVGIACLDSRTQHIICTKALGGVANLALDSEMQAQVVLGHTRWATHGSVTLANAHPHTDCTQAIGVVHNGIIENYAVLKEQLRARGHLFNSETDTEIIAHQLEDIFQTIPDSKSALLSLIHMLEGAYAIVCIAATDPEAILFARNRSPLCVGFGTDCAFIASDMLAFVEHVEQFFFVPDQTIGIIRKNSVEMWSFSGTEIKPEMKQAQTKWVSMTRDGHEHYMLKEIYEQKRAITNTVHYLQNLGANLWQQIGLSREQITNLSSLKLLGCGTSWHAGRIAQFFFESIARIPTAVHLASEYRYMPFFKQENTVSILISQSGETADTREALHLLSSHTIATIALVNVAESVMVHEADGYLVTQAGPEIAVASTKSFSAQLAVMYWFAHALARERGDTTICMDTVSADLVYAATLLELSIDQYRDVIVSQYAPYYAQFNRAICLGRHISYPFAMEVALKIKEIDYIFAQCYPAGELKHGPLALIDTQTPVFVFSLLDPISYKKLISNVQEAKARGAHIVAFGFVGQHELQQIADVWFELPVVSPLLAPLVMTGITQFFVYAIAKQLGLPIDKPRNLAKSVTVE